MKRLFVYMLGLSTLLWSDEFLGRWRITYQSSQHKILSQTISGSEFAVQKGIHTFGNGFGEFSLEARHLFNTDVELKTPFIPNKLAYRATTIGINVDHVRPDGIMVGLGVGYQMNNLSYTFRPTPTSLATMSSTFKTPVANLHFGYRFSSVVLGVRVEKSLLTDSTDIVNRFSPSRSIGAFISYTF